jgi:tRNA/tmRNA/rRNA uracil-C5-methylase (TrmA/RlmC/RlmD family)
VKRAGRVLDDLVGPLEVGPVAHGGHCVARHEGRVVFVRHALPGEVVRIRITDTSHDRFWRADAVEVLTASPDRVAPPCPIAGPGLCGGCDFQHVDLAAQRRLKAAVVAEQLQRLAGIEWSGPVEAVDREGRPDEGRPDEVRPHEGTDGLGWRTRMRYHVDASGRAGLRRHRSHDVVPMPDQGCLIAAPELPSVAGGRWPPSTELLAAAAGTESATLLADNKVLAGDPVLVEQAAGRRWSVAAAGFWQVHRGAADLLGRAVLDALQPQPGESGFDLYAGVGLFAGVLADQRVQVWAVEADRSAAAAARENLADLAGRVRVVAGRVDRMLGRLPPRCDLVVLDPPRTGAGAAVVRGMLTRRPRAVAYVACDPAALARDLATAGRLGYLPRMIRAFDLFPMTHHVECLAQLEPVGP